MAEFTADFQSSRPSFPFLVTDHNIEELGNQFKGIMNPHVLDNSIFNIPDPEFSGNLELEEDFLGLVHCSNHNAVPTPVSLLVSSAENEIHEGENKKVTDMCEPSSANSTTTISESRSKTKNSCGRRKRTKRNVTEDKKANEVVHVRARRGQATDSHSLAERVRRRKINEKLECLQNIVPGCHKKTMGMTIMLDEIINYVQSLQHQVEFLSMKLTAASTFHDFNSEIDALETMQRERTLEANVMAKYMKEEYEEVSCFQPTWP